jgi:uncharacterized protein YndB with AHSA1/START domain
VATTGSTTPITRKIGAMTLTLKSDVEIELSRTFEAPRELVFEAHSKAEHVRQWWGSKDTTMPVCDMDFRPGGGWRYVIRKPNGKEYGFGGTFVEIVPPEWFSWMFGVDGMPGEGLEVYRFTEHDGKTTLTTTSHFPSVEIRDAVIASGMENGAAELFDRLEEYLGTMGRS